MKKLLLLLLISSVAFGETYKALNGTSAVKRLPDGAVIPADPGNKDYKQYQVWVASGNVITPADPLPTAGEILAELRAGATNFYLTTAHPIAIVERGVILVTKDELNLIRQWFMSFKTQVAASTTLADLKTRVAALPDMPDRQDSQIRGAIQSKITAGTAD